MIVKNINVGLFSHAKDEKPDAEKAHESVSRFHNINCIYNACQITNVI